MGTLATVTATDTPITGAASGAFRVMSVKASWNLTGLTAGDGPIVLGYCHSDYTVSEIKECIEAASAVDLGDKIQQERANRLIRVVGTLNESGGLNDGKVLSTKLNWRINPGETVAIFAYNDGGALLTTGSVVQLNGDLWVKDV